MWLPVGWISVQILLLSEAQLKGEGVAWSRVPPAGFLN
jgi:hypothetical protein